MYGMQAIFFEKKSKKNSPVFLRATNKGDFLRATFFLRPLFFCKKKVALKNGLGTDKGDFFFFLND